MISTFGAMINLPALVTENVVVQRGSPALAQQFFGHASITTTMGYAHLAAQHLRSLVAIAVAAAANQ